METIYEARMATKESEVMLLRAMVEPMLMRERRHVTMNDTTMLFIGTSQPGRTCDIPVSNARLFSKLQRTLTYANHEDPGMP